MRLPVRLLLLFSMPALLLASNCIKECVKSSSYYNANCPDGAELGEDCDDSTFCSTPYARCQDKKCACLPDFKPRNMTMGAPAICIPETLEANYDIGRDPTSDICRFNIAVGGRAGQFQDTARQLNEYSEEYELAVYQRSLDSENEDVRRHKRQVPFILPPTVVNECRKSQQCFQIATSAYGVCKVPKCRVGTPEKTPKECDSASNTGCGAGYTCKSTKGQTFDRDSGTHSGKSHCCPVICDQGYYKFGRCWKNQECLKVHEDCEDRCLYEPCRFMVDPCMNFGTCLVPRVTPGSKPDYFWCKCPAGKTGLVCESEAASDSLMNRPSSDKLIPCVGSLCEMPPPRTPISSQPSLTQARRTAANPLTSLQSIVRPCRMDTHKETCERLASEGACTTNREYMIQNCDCACTRLLSRNKAIRYFPIPTQQRHN